MARVMTGLLILACGALLAAGAAAPPPLEGVWGGERIRVAATAGDIEIQIACLRGRSDEPVTLDADGAFTVSLRLLPMQGANLQEDDVRAPATVRGRVRGDELRVEVGPAGSEGAGTYVLTRGRRATLPDCRRRG